MTKNKKTQLLHIDPKNISVKENFNSRRDFGDIEELASQIAKDGILNPIHVQEIPNKEGKYTLVDGERRFRAVLYNLKQGITMDAIPALLVNEKDLKDLYRIQVQTNEGKNFNEYEYGIAYSRLRDLGMSNQEIAKFVGKKLYTVSYCIGHLSRDKRVQELLKEERITGVDVRHIYQAHKNEEEAVRTILKLKEYADEHGEHKLCLKNLKKVKDIVLSDNIFDKTTIAMDTTSIKNGLYKLIGYMQKVDPSKKKNFTIKYIVDELKKGKLIDEILELNNTKKKAE